MIYVFLANGFEEIEALTTVDILRRAGIQVKTVGVQGKTVAGCHGISVAADLEDKEVQNEDFDGIVMPGGLPGVTGLQASDVVKSAVLDCMQHDKYMAAICAGPVVLGQLGALAGKKAVCYPGFEQELKGAIPWEGPVCVDQKIITAKGAGVTILFALKIVEQILNKETARKIRKSIQCIEEISI